MDNKFLKMGICALAGAAAGFAVYKTVKIGFDKADESRKVLQEAAEKRLAVAVAEMEAIKQNPNSTALQNTESIKKVEDAKNDRYLKEESKGDIIHHGAKTAAIACGAVNVAAQCVSGIADSISQMANVIHGNNISPMFGNGYAGFNNGNYNQQINMSNGQTWLRVSPFVVDTRPYNPGYQDYYNNYSI